MKPVLSRRELRVPALALAALLVNLAILTFAFSRPSARADFTAVLKRLDTLDAVTRIEPLPSTVVLRALTARRLIFYNRPPKTGSTTVRIAMKNALEANSMTAAKCFNMIEWNEMAIKTIVNQRDVDFYGCHTRLTPARYEAVSHMRDGNVTFITNTRDPKDIILSAYLQANRKRDVTAITDLNDMKREVENYKQHVESYHIAALYDYHGADVPLGNCPAEWKHEDAMRRVAERYEVVIDLKRPSESAAMVEAVTGLRPEFTGRYNERTKDTSGAMLRMLKEIDTSHMNCGNELVHKVLMQQFNIIKDRLMQNRCFNEDLGTFELCEKTELRKDEIVERTRDESFKTRNALLARIDSSEA